MNVSSQHRTLPRFGPLAGTFSPWARPGQSQLLDGSWKYTPSRIDFRQIIERVADFGLVHHVTDGDPAVHVVEDRGPLRLRDSVDARVWKKSEHLVHKSSRRRLAGPVGAVLLLHADSLLVRATEFDGIVP